MSLLLEADPAIIRRIEASDQVEKEEESNVYWLCYNPTGDRLSVHRSRKEMKDGLLLETSQKPPTLLCLTLRQFEKGSVVAAATREEKPNDKNSNPIGTKLLHHDENVNIWEFRLHPGEECPFHSHELRYCFSNLSESVTLALDKDGKASGDPNPQTMGQTVYVDQDSLGSHAVRNVGFTPFLQFIVEFKY